MHTSDVAPTLTPLFSELIDGTSGPGGNVVLNTGDVGLLRSLDNLSASDASESVNGGATIAAHAQHVRYGLSLMNRWATEGVDPFADATWDAAWNTTNVDARAWGEIRQGLREETHRWLKALGQPREASEFQLTGILASIAHLAYHLGAIRKDHEERSRPAGRHLRVVVADIDAIPQQHPPNSSPCSPAASKEPRWRNLHLSGLVSRSSPVTSSPRLAP